jgi:hypothetical protein
MSKKHRDISTYLVSNKRQRSNADENNSETSTTTPFYDTNSNNSSEILGNNSIKILLKN